MPRKQARPATLAEQLARIKTAGFKPGQTLKATPEAEDLPPVSERIERLLAQLRKLSTLKPTEMLCIISYDIEDNRVRRLVAKYLIRQGCQRIQKSVYFARVERTKYIEMVQSLKEVQQTYDNHDSVFFLPVGEDNLNRMELIGQMLHVEMTVNPPHTLFI